MKTKRISWVVFIAAAIIFLGLKISMIEYSASDENTYYKMGQLASEGRMPYKDFFFAHPPLQIYLYAAVFMLFGFNLAILKMLSAGAAVIAAVFVFKTLKEKSEIAAATGTLLFFFTHAILLFTSYPTGTEFVMMFSAAGFYYFYKKRSMASGIMFGLGTITGLLALMPAAAISAWLLLRNIREFIRFMKGFLIIAVPVNAFFLVMSEGAYFTQTITYNLLKPEGVLDAGSVISRVIMRNWLLLAAALTSVFAAKKLSRGVFVPAIIVTLYAALFFYMNTVFDYYFLNMAPYLAILAGLGITGFVNRFKLRKAVAYGAIMIVVIFASYSSYANVAADSTYDFEAAQEAAAYIKENSAENELIFGEDATTPLISLLSERGIALDFADSNDLRFRSGLEDTGKAIEGLRNNVRYFLVRKLDLGDDIKIAYGVGTLREFKDFFEEECEEVKEFETPWNGKVKEYIIYDCG